MISKKPQKISPADHYEAAADLQVITCFFNPAKYQTKRENYERFMAPLRAGGVPTITVECAFGDSPFELPSGPDMLQVRGTSLMFQKERILNLALPHLRPACTKVAWLDADVLFDRPDWITATSAVLDQFVVVQPFEYCHRLPRGTSSFNGCGRRWESFAAVYQRDPRLLATGRYDEHGHVGFAWAARRTLLDKLGLRDSDISGHSDHLMAHAAVGDWNTLCFRRLVGSVGPYAESTRRWAQAFHDECRGKMGYVPGTLLHLWHGRIADRRYYKLSLDLRAFGFDPEWHLVHDASGLWAWRDEAAEMSEQFEVYFGSRREDG